MKGLMAFFSVATMVAFLSGCASDVVYVPKIPPQAQAKLLDYFEQPDNKVFVIAIDPGGDFSYGYDYGKATLKEAAKVAVEKCDAQREAHGIIAKPYIYAINNKVVYEQMIRKAAQAKRAGMQGMSAESKAQVDEAARQEATGEASNTGDGM